MMPPFSFDVDEDLKQAFTDAAAAAACDSADVLREAMRNFVDRLQDAAAYDRWFRDQVEQGRQDAEAGNLISHEEVEAEAEIWRTTMMRQPSGRGL